MKKRSAGNNNRRAPSKKAAKKAKTHVEDENEDDDCKLRSPAPSERFVVMRNMGSRLKSVYEAKDTLTGKMVALKRVRCDGTIPGTTTAFGEGFHPGSLRELSVLQTLAHPSTVKMLEIWEQSTEVDESSTSPSMDTYMVLEYGGEKLQHSIQSSDSGLPKQLCKELLFQLLAGVAHCHSWRIVHRNLKPRNILYNPATNRLRMIDFSHARILDTNKALTGDFGTPWYRSPEVLLGTPKYDTKVDIWSVGCIMGEVVNKKPLFSGDSKIDELLKIFRARGTPPTNAHWPEAVELPHWGDTYPQWRPQDLTELANIDHTGADLLSRLLTCSPAQRTSAQDALAHPYFADLDPHWRAQYSATDCDSGQLPVVPSAEITPSKVSHPQPATVVLIHSPTGCDKKCRERLDFSFS